MKDIIISKELLIEVLEVEISDFNIIGNKLNYIIPNYETEEDGELLYINLGQNINIYEFAFKCKDWALKQGYMMKIENHYSNSIQIQIRKNISSSEYLEPWKKTFKSEVEAIIEACEWVLQIK